MKAQHNMGSESCSEVMDRVPGHTWQELLARGVYRECLGKVEARWKDTWELARLREQHGQWGAGCSVALEVTTWLGRLGGHNAGDGGRSPGRLSFVGVLRSLDLPEAIQKTLNSLIVSDFNSRKNLPAARSLENELR